MGERQPMPIGIRADAERNRHALKSNPVLDFQESRPLFTGVTAQYLVGRVDFSDEEFAPMEPLLDTETAAAALANLGVPRSPATLRKLRCTGGGPRFRRLGNKPVYTQIDLITWIESRLSEPVGSNAEAGAK